MTLCTKMVQRSEGPIHSGHFMLSEVHKEQDNGEEFDGSDDNGPMRKRRNSVYKYVRGNVTFFIDRTLNNLFRCLNMAYSGKIPSPRWNGYKDLKLRLKDCIRLNNLIWREWFKQSLLGHKPVLCNLNAPTSSATEKRSDYVFLEGKYWRRNQQAVQEEYRRWRLPAVISRNCSCRQIIGKNILQNKGETDSRVKSCNSFVGHIPISSAVAVPVSSNSQIFSSTTAATPGLGPPTPLSNFCDYDNDDMWVADFSDTLFNNLCNNLFEFPDPKALGPLGNADLIQPGLVQFQPFSDVFPKAAPFLSDLQPFNPSLSSTWPLDNESPSPFLGSLGKQQNTKMPTQSAAFPPSPFQQEVQNRSVLYSQETQDTRPIQPLPANTELTQPSSMGVEFTNMADPYQPLPQMPASYETTSTSEQPAYLIGQSQQEYENTRGPYFVQQSADSMPPFDQQQSSSGRRRHHSGVVSGSQQQPLNSVTFAPDARQSSTIVRFNPTVASLLQNSNNDTTVESMAEKNNSLMVLSAAASACSTVNMNPGFVDSVCTNLGNNMTPSSQDDSKMRQPSTMKAVRQISKHQQQQFLVPQQNAEIPVMLSNVQQQQRNWSQETLVNSVNSNEPLTPLSADLSSSGLPLKKRPRSDSMHSSHHKNDAVFQQLSNSSTSSSSNLPRYPIGLQTSSSIHGEVNSNQSGNVLFQMRQPKYVPPVQKSHFNNGSQLESSVATSNVASSSIGAPSEKNSDRRRFVHIVCESRRRNAITTAMERLNELLPESFAPRNKGQSGGSGRGRRVGLSQAALLCNVARFLDELTAEANQLANTVGNVRDEISKVSAEVSHLQSSLPLVGACQTSGSSAPVGGRFGTPAGQRSRALSRFDIFVKRKSEESWKFVLLSMLLKPLYPAFLDVVKIDLIGNPNSVQRKVIRTDEASLHEWIAQACSLPALRQASSHLLLELARSSPVLEAPEKLPIFLIQQQEQNR